MQASDHSMCTRTAHTLSACTHAHAYASAHAQAYALTHALTHARTHARTALHGSMRARVHATARHCTPSHTTAYTHACIVRQHSTPCRAMPRTALHTHTHTHAHAHAHAHVHAHVHTVDAADRTRRHLCERRVPHGCVGAVGCSTDVGPFLSLSLTHTSSSLLRSGTCLRS